MNSTHILLMTWNHPPCRNMDVKMVIQDSAGRLITSAGTSPHVRVRRSRPAGLRLSSYRNTNTFKAMSSQLTSGNRRECSVSYSGIIRLALGPEAHQLLVDSRYRLPLSGQGDTPEHEAGQVVIEPGNQRHRQRRR